MKIIHWNCQGAFRVKTEKIFVLKPDILVISECEEIEKLKVDQWYIPPTYCHWYGTNKHKGIAVFVFIEAEVSLHNSFNSAFRYILPFSIRVDTKVYMLFAIWAMDDKVVRAHRYTGQIILAMDYYKSLLHDQCLLIGDFNSNKYWDRKGKFANHMSLVDQLKKYDIVSLYHQQYVEDHGEESQPTFYLYRDIEKPYHLDYCFASTALLESGYDYSVGSYKDWITLSDHCPIIANINC